MTTGNIIISYVKYDGDNLGHGSFEFSIQGIEKFTDEQIYEFVINNLGNGENLTRYNINYPNFPIKGQLVKENKINKSYKYNEYCILETITLENTPDITYVECVNVFPSEKLRDAKFIL